jgi:hypothetical protein
MLLDGIGRGLIDGSFDGRDGDSAAPRLVGNSVVIRSFAWSHWIARSIALCQLNRSTANIQRSSGVSADSSYFATRKLDGICIDNISRYAFKTRLYDFHELVVIVAGESDTGEAYVEAVRYLAFLTTYVSFCCTYLNDC